MQIREDVVFAVMVHVCFEIWAGHQKLGDDSPIYEDHSEPAACVITGQLILGTPKTVPD